MERVDKSEFNRLFREIFFKNQLERFCAEEIMDRFAKFTEILLEANEKFNLTAIKALPEVIAKHYADCLLAEECFPAGATVLDVGCGGGFPTFPLAIVRPDLKITALDSTQKKIDFVSFAAKELGLSNVVALCSRAEAPELQKYRESFDAVTSRAMARMSVLSELTIPFLRMNGRLVALKGVQGEEELAEAANGIGILGGEIVEDRFCVLKTREAEESRHLLVIVKKKQTPKTYPRQYAAILKKPLGCKV